MTHPSKWSTNLAQEISRAPSTFQYVRAMDSGRPVSEQYEAWLALTIEAHVRDQDQSINSRGAMEDETRSRMPIRDIQWPGEPI